MELTHKYGTLSYLTAFCALSDSSSMKLHLLSREQVQFHLCRKEATRTPDPYVPNVVRYQLRYFPISVAKLGIFDEIRKVFFYFFVFTSIVILGN